LPPVLSGRRIASPRPDKASYALKLAH
jgi:hypothetical protein